MFYMALQFTACQVGVEDLKHPSVPGAKLAHSRYQLGDKRSILGCHWAVLTLPLPLPRGSGMGTRVWSRWAWGRFSISLWKVSACQAKRRYHFLFPKLDNRRE